MASTTTGTTAAMAAALTSAHVREAADGRTPIFPRLDVVAKLRNEFGDPLVVLPWWIEFFDALDDPNYHELILILVRQTGKSTVEGAAASTELFVPNSYTLLVAGSADQIEAIAARKIRKPLEASLTPGMRKMLGVRFTRRGVEFKALGSVLELIASNEFTAPGRTPTKVFIDEARDVADEVYVALAPSVIGAGGKVIIASTTGRASGFFHTLVNNPTPETWLYRSTDNTNPRADQRVVGFMKRRLALVSPAAARRELHGEFTDDGDELIAAPLIDAAIDDGLGELASSPREAFAFLDLSRKRDLTSLVVVVREEGRRPEAHDHLVVASIATFDPKQSPTSETDFAKVRAALGQLPLRFPNLLVLSVDEGAEAGTVLPFCREHPRLSLVVQGFTGSVTSNMTLWGALSGRLNGRTISIPRHERLVAELRGLRRTEFAFGSKYRIVDSTRRLHRDVSLSLAGACMAAGALEACDICGAPGCSGYHVLGATGADAPATVPRTAPGRDTEAASETEYDDADDEPPRTALSHLTRASDERFFRGGAAPTEDEFERRRRRSAAEVAAAVRARGVWWPGG